MAVVLSYCQARLLVRLAKPVDLRLRRVDGLPVLYENLDDIDIPEVYILNQSYKYNQRLLSLFFNSKHYKLKSNGQSSLLRSHQ